MQQVPGHVLEVLIGVDAVQLAVLDNCVHGVLPAVGRRQGRGALSYTPSFGKSGALDQQRGVVFAFGESIVIRDQILHG